MTAPQRGMEFGIGLRGDFRRADRIARLADESGFDVLTVFADLGFGSPLAPLLLAASATERVRLGPACLNPYTTHPVEIASQIATLDLLSGGRAYVGLARGAWLETIAVAQPRPVRALREAAAIIDLLLRGDDAGYQGELFSVAPGFRLQQSPRRKVPLLLGAWGPQTVALAGEIADELKVGGSANPELVPLIKHRLGAGSETRIVMGAVTVVDDDRRAAREAARKAVGMYFDVVARYDPTVDVAGGLSDDLLDRFAFAGTPKQIASQVRRLFDAGVARVEFGGPFALEPHAGVELLAREVLPEFR